MSEPTAEMTVSTTPFPVAPEEITVDWIRRVLSDYGVREAEALASIELDPVADGFGVISTFAIIRLQYTSGASRAPETLFAKFSSGTDISMMLSEREVHFFLEMASKIAIRIPRCYFAATDGDGDHALLLLEDVSAARGGDSLNGCSIEEANLVLRELAALHASWWNHPILRKQKWVDRFRDVDTASVGSRFRNAWQTFESRYGDLLPGWAVDLALRGLDSVPLLFRLLSSGPRTLVHGDPQLDNVRFGLGDAPIVFLDWQLAMSGQASWDLYWFLVHALPIEMRRANEEALVSDYLQTLRRAGIRYYSVERLMQEMTVGWILSFLTIIQSSIETNFAGERGAKLRAEFIRRHIAVLEDHEVWKMLS